MFRGCPAKGERNGNQIIIDVPEKGYVMIYNLFGTSIICYLSSHAPHTRDSYGARLQSDNIGLSPPPGTPPAAITLMTEVSLFPRICHCRHRLLSGFRCLSFFARFLTEGLGAPTSIARGAGFSHMSDIQFSSCF